MTSTLHIIVPGLVAANALWPTRMPALSRLLGRGRRVSLDGRGAARMFRTFGLEVADPPPVAAVTRLADEDVPPGAWCLRFDPVSLRADLHHVHLLPAAALDLSADEARALAALFNDTLAADGLRLHAPTPTRWYLEGANRSDVVSIPPAELAGDTLPQDLPGGPDGRRWRGLMSEVQMLFHECAVNRDRALAGKLPVNGLWPWGGGTLPGPPEACPWQRVFGNDALCRGLARLAGVPIEPVPEDASAVVQGMQPGDAVLVVLGDGDMAPVMEGWSEIMALWEAAWFVPLERALARGQLGMLQLDPGSGPLCRLRRASLWCLWRRAVEVRHWAGRVAA